MFNKLCGGASRPESKSDNTSLSCSLSRAPFDNKAAIFANMNFTFNKSILLLAGAGEAELHRSVFSN